MAHVYIDHFEYTKLVKQAVENDGRVVIEAKGFSPVEIIVPVERAKKDMAEIEDNLKQAIGKLCEIDFSSDELTRIADMADKFERVNPISPSDLRAALERSKNAGL